MDKYQILASYINSKPWAITPEALLSVQRVLSLYGQGMTFSDEELKSRLGAVHGQRGGQQGAIAVIPVVGPIDHRESIFLEIFGGSSVERISKNVRQAANDPSITAIVLDIESPGGSVFGVDELSKEIFEARDKKKIIAVANSYAASAAYNIASAATEFVATPSAMVGSIGVFATHFDFSEALQQAGINPTLISAGEFKTEANQFEPLTDEAKADIQHRVNSYFNQFVQSVARNRGVSAATVKSDFGKGRVVNAKEAKAAGMIDRIATFDETIQRISGRMRSGVMRSEGSTNFKSAEERKREIELLALQV